MRENTGGRDPWGNNQIETNNLQIKTNNPLNPPLLRGNLSNAEKD